MVIQVCNARKTCKKKCKVKPLPLMGLKGRSLGASYHKTWNPRRLVGHQNGLEELGWVV